MLGGSQASAPVGGVLVGRGWSHAVSRFMKKLLHAIAIYWVLFVCCLSSVAENEVGFIERFALAADRKAALSELVPGTPDFYYFHALQAQQVGDKTRFAEIIEDWSKRHGGDVPARRTLLNRQALLDFDQNPVGTYQYLRERLGVVFPHQRDVPDRKPNLPTGLNQATVAFDAFAADAKRDPGLGSVTAVGIGEWVAVQTTLKDTQRVALLERVQRPDHAGLIDLVSWDLTRSGGTRFGTRPIHNALLPDQLDVLQQRIPTLAKEEAFVFARVRKLAPSPDVDVVFDEGAREAWLNGLWNYVSTLPDSFNALKANVLYRRLDHDRRRGKYDRARFELYLALPRQVPYANPEWLRGAVSRGVPCALDQGFGDVLQIDAPVGNDEPLVREYFLHFFAEEARKQSSASENLARPFYDKVRDSWLRPVLAEAVITSGVGKPEEWASLLGGAAFQALKDRTDVDFPANNPEFFRQGDSVKFDVWVKNVPEVAVNIFEINALNVFLAEGRPLNTDLNLDGVVPNWERTLKVGGDPFSRKRVSVELPELAGKRGAWLVELIGGGRSSRALVRIGNWRTLQRTGPAGVEVTVLDEALARVKGASAWLDGRRFEADAKSGVITLPFTQTGGERSLVLSDATGGFAVLSKFLPVGEEYRMEAGFHLEREQMIAGADVLAGVRVYLALGSVRLDPKLLKEKVLTVSSRGADGIASTREIRDPKFDGAGFVEVPVRIPEGLRSLTISLRGKVASMSNPEGVMLNAERTWNVNGMDAGVQLRRGFLSKERAESGEAWVFEVLGRNGEAMSDVPVQFSFRRRGFSGTRGAMLKTDASGRIRLGSMEGIEGFSSMIEGGVARDWSLQQARRTFDSAVHLRVGEELRVPIIMGSEWRGRFSLMEVRQGHLVRELNERMERVEGFVVWKGLEAGDYVYQDEREGLAVEIRVSKAPIEANWALGDARDLERGIGSGLHLLASEVQGEAVVFRFAGLREGTRIHVAGRRFLDSGSLFTGFAEFSRWGLASGNAAQIPNLFSAGRRIGDEYRYIRDRRKAEKFPGLMLPRPGLLLNPWETRETGAEALQQRRGDRAQATAGERMAKMAAAPASAPLGLMDRSGVEGDESRDFLATPAALRWDLQPLATGEIRVPFRDLGDRQMVQVYAEDGYHAVWGEVAVRKATLERRDVRMSRPLDPAQSFAEERGSTAIGAGSKVRFADIATTKFQTFGTVAEAFGLLKTLLKNYSSTGGSGDAQGAVLGGELDWLVGWDALDAETKRVRYSAFASHEVNLFLWRKDPKFFGEVIRPYLSNKKLRGLVDDFLLEEDLTPYLEPWRYGRLNVMEKLLLAVRIPAERSRAKRHVSEMLSLMPVDREGEQRRFDTALSGRGLDGSDGDTVALVAEESGRMSGFLAAGVAGAKGGNAVLASSGAGVANKPAFAGGALGANRAMDKRAIDAVSERVREASSVSRSEVRMLKDASGREEKGEADRDAAEAGKMLRKAMEMQGFKQQAGANGIGLGDAEAFGVVAEKEVLDSRKKAREYYRVAGPTKEFAESDYLRVRRSAAVPDLVRVSGFWADFASWIEGGMKGSFLSGRFTESARSGNEVLLVLAFLDLPFRSDGVRFERSGAALDVGSDTPVMVLHRQVQLVPEMGSGAGRALVTQNFFRADDRHRDEAGERVEKFVEGDFVRGVVYGASVVIGNPTGGVLKGDLLWQVPAGAIPLANGKGTESRPLRLDPYATTRLEFLFYFPEASPVEADGFVHHPATVRAMGGGVMRAGARVFRVLERSATVDEKSWEHISQNGTEAEVFGYLDSHSGLATPLERVAWRCQERGFFLKLAAWMRTNHAWNTVVAGYGLKHGDAVSVSEWLRHQDAFIRQCGPALKSGLLTIDPVERGGFEFLEFSPLINPRAHRVGEDWRIGNEGVRRQYDAFLRILAHQTQLDAADRVAVSVHLLMQDRVGDARKWFTGARTEQAGTGLQVEYLRGVFELLSEKPAEVKRIAEPFVNHPVERWRMLFRGLMEQADVAMGRGEGEGTRGKDRETRLDALAGTEPEFELEVAGQGLRVRARNLAEVQLNFYPADPEFSFSGNPFGREESGRFRMVKPAMSVTHKVSDAKEGDVVPVPTALKGRNLVVEATGAGIRRSVHFSVSQMRVDFVENYGRVEVRDREGTRPMSKVYVKVYARVAGGVRFFKDGYTDVRGRFDYASLNGPVLAGASEPAPASAGMDHPAIRPGEIALVERFAVLVFSDEAGAVIRDVAAPARTDAPLR